MSSSFPREFQFERELDVPPTTAWKVLADIEGWPHWVPFIRRAKLDGAVLRGGGFRCDPGAQRCTLTHVEKPRRLSWLSESLGSRRWVEWELIDAGPGRSRIVCRQQQAGWWLRAASWFGRDPGQEEARRLENWVEALGRRVRSEVPCD